MTSQDWLRGICRAVLLAGATGCVALTLYVGRRNSSAVLMAMFVIWVLTPFMAFGWTETKSKSLSIRTLGIARRAMIALTVEMSAIYWYVAFEPRITKAAAPFLFVPAISLLVFGIVVLRARRKG